MATTPLFPSVFDGYDDPIEALYSATAPLRAALGGDGWGLALEVYVVDWDHFSPILTVPQVCLAADHPLAQGTARRVDLFDPCMPVAESATAFAQIARCALALETLCENHAYAYTARTKIYMRVVILPCQAVAVVAEDPDGYVIDAGHEERVADGTPITDPHLGALAIAWPDSAHQRLQAAALARDAARMMAALSPAIHHHAAEGIVWDPNNLVLPA